jgi:hypothetical protein
VKHNLKSVLTGDRTGAHSVLVGRLEVTRSLGKPRLRWKDNIKMDVSRSGVGRHGLDYSGSELGQGPCCCKCGNVLSDSIKFGEFLD